LSGFFSLLAGRDLPLGMMAQQSGRAHEGGVDLSSHPDVPDASLQPQEQAPQPLSVGWALRRTALWLLMLSTMVAAGAWLFYASIDPDEAAAGPATSQETVETSR
jgi:hypothetical protein